MEAQYQIALISVVGTLTVAVIGLLGNWFLANQNKKKELLIKEKEIEQQEVKFVLENLKNFWEYQNNVFQDVLKTASTLTFNENINSEEFQNAYKKLWELKFAILPICGVEEVEKALDEFDDLAYEKKRLDPNASEKINDKKKEMKPYLKNLSVAIRNASMFVEYSNKIKTKIKNSQN